MIKRLLNPNFYLKRRSSGRQFVFVRPNHKEYRAIVKQVLKQHREALLELRDR